MPRIGVYGSLRKGMSNHAKMRPAPGAAVPESLATVRIPGRLLSLGPYCSIVPHPTDTVVAEIYDVTEGVFAALDAMEREFDYEGREIAAGGLTFVVWYYRGEPVRDAVHIASGDWVEFTGGIDPPA